LNVNRAFRVHLNPDYVRNGEVDITQLFVTVDMTARIDQISDEVARETQEARTYLLAEAEPKGPCSCIYKGRAKHCTPFEYSNPDVPKYSVHDSSPKKLKELVDAGIFSLADLPAHIALSASQKTQLQVFRSGETIIDKEAIAEGLAELAFPLHFRAPRFELGTSCAQGRSRVGSILVAFSLLLTFFPVPLR